MYIEQGGGLAGAGRIGLVTFSKTGRTIYYRGRTLISTKSGYESNHIDQETREPYWVSGPRKDGQDTLYPGLVEIDDDIREEYWRDVRALPENAHLASYRSLGRHAQSTPRADPPKSGSPYRTSYRQLRAFG